MLKKKILERVIHLSIQMLIFAGFYYLVSVVHKGRYMADWIVFNKWYNVWVVSFLFTLFGGYKYGYAFAIGVWVSYFVGHWYGVWEMEETKKKILDPIERSLVYSNEVLYWIIFSFLSITIPFWYRRIRSLIDKVNSKRKK